MITREDEKEHNRRLAMDEFARTELQRLYPGVEISPGAWAKIRDSGRTVAEVIGRRPCDCAGACSCGSPTRTRDAAPRSVPAAMTAAASRRRQQPWDDAGTATRWPAQPDSGTTRRLNASNNERYAEEGDAGAVSFSGGRRSGYEIETDEGEAPTLGEAVQGAGERVGGAVSGAASTIASHRGDAEGAAGPPRWTEAQRGYYGRPEHEPGRVPTAGPNANRYGATGETDGDYGRYYVEGGHDETPTRRSPPPRVDENWVAGNWMAAGSPIDEPRPLAYHGPVARSGPAPMAGNVPSSRYPNNAAASPNVGDPDRWTEQRGADPDPFMPRSAGVGGDAAGLRMLNNRNRRKNGDAPLRGPLPRMQRPEATAEVNSFHYRIAR